MRRLFTLVAVACAIVAWSGTAAAAPGCEVSKLAPIKGRTAFNVGTLRLAVALPRMARYVAVPDGWRGGGNAFVETSGRIRIKLGWLSPSGGPRGLPNGGPLVTGRRLDRPAAPLKVSMGVKSFALGSGEFYPSYLYFPTTGCWHITARNAEARLTFTVRVVKQ